MVGMPLHQLLADLEPLFVLAMLEKLLHRRPVSVTIPAPHLRSPYQG